MISTKPKDDQSIQYPSRTVERAERAMRCSPFELHLFAAMGFKSVSLQAITGEAGIQQQYTRHRLSELAAENALSWLIQVGVLRREVDGQGITDSFRLTPLGRQLVDKSQRQGYWFTPSVSDRIYNALARWFRLPYFDTKLCPLGILDLERLKIQNRDNSLLSILNNLPCR